MKKSCIMAAAAATLALTMGGTSGCKKESAGESTSPVIAASATAGATDDAKDEPGDPAAAASGTDPGAADTVGAAGGGAADRAASPSDKGDMVAIGSSGKAQVIGTDKKTIADTDTYTITLAAPAKLAKGAKGAATLEIVPKTGWKLNQEFPTKITITPPAGVEVAKTEQSVKDAVAFGEKSARFAINFTSASSGDKAFSGKLKFAVCTEVSCDPKKEELAWNVQVE